ncbi:MAG: thioredoxin domain-containing protein [Verrucomicrobiae bacterium]|nr:thioredoxin domain-containing protein [Verrucomicrobiae bacterium]
MTATPKFTNRLSRETSPYLLQHAHNPVDWYPWGPEALARAQSEDKPILLSIGYSACHWCHVMEHESFEDEETARLMNQWFVCVKVDREERPDLDHIYMMAVQAMTGQGGWPLNVWLTPDGRPFFGGTYFPPDNRYGRTSFPAVLTWLHKVWTEKRDVVEKESAGLLEDMDRFSGGGISREEFSPRVLEILAGKMVEGIDPVHGGFGQSPKFPQAMSLMFLLRQVVRTGEGTTRERVRLTLDKMARGGMYDQIGGGFCRYSTDETWLVPHFEKMLYDNALLARTYLEAWQLYGDAFYAEISRGILDYVLREMTSPEGGFYSTQDADSEGVEGKFFVWQQGEMEAALGGEAALACEYWGVTRHGNWEENNILHVPVAHDEFARAHGIPPADLHLRVGAWKQRLFSLREGRIKPGRDEKILAAWNGMMLTAFAGAAAVWNEERYRQAALSNASFLLGKMRREGRLWRNFREGRATLNAYLEDYALVAEGLIAVYEMTGDQTWLHEAESLTEVVLAQFADETGGFYFTSRDHETLVKRPKEIDDNATPCGNSVMAMVLLRLGALLGRQPYTERARQSLGLIRDLAPRMPTGLGYWLCAADFMVHGPTEIALIGTASELGPFESVLSRRFLPAKLVCKSAEEGSQLPLLRGRGRVGDRATVYLCHQQTCLPPITHAEEFDRELERLSRSGKS